MRSTCKRRFELRKLRNHATGSGFIIWVVKKFQKKWKNWLGDWVSIFKLWKENYLLLRLFHCQSYVANIEKFCPPTNSPDYQREGLAHIFKCSQIGLTQVLTIWWYPKLWVHHKFFLINSHHPYVNSSKKRRKLFVDFRDQDLMNETKQEGTKGSPCWTPDWDNIIWLPKNRRECWE